MARRYGYGINLAPFIDVVFILLAFMLIYARIDMSQSIEVDLPSAAGSSLENHQPLIVSIDRDGNFFLGENKITAEVLQEELRQFANTDEQTLIVQADKNATVQALVELMEILSHAQIPATRILVSGE